MLKITVDKLYELFGNLVLAGFTNDEALHITAIVAAQNVERAVQMLVLWKLEIAGRRPMWRLRLRRKDKKW